MTNPQMVNGMGQLPDLPSQSELWKEERSKYRPFIIMFGIGIIAVFALLLASFILNVTNGTIKSQIADKLYQINSSHYDEYTDPMGHARSDANGWYTTYVLAYPIVSFSLLGIGVLLYVVSVYESYQNKSFAKLSSFATAIVFIGAMFSAFLLLQMAWSDYAKLQTIFKGGIFQIIAQALVIALAILGSQVSKIKRIFFTSARVEAIKSDPTFMAAQEQYARASGQNSNVGAYGPAVTPPIAPPHNHDAPTPHNAIPSVHQQELSKLEAMSIVDLRKVAKKLFISGSDKMEKKELIEAIMRITTSGE